MYREVYRVKGPSNTFIAEDTLIGRYGNYWFTDEEIDAKLFYNPSEVHEAVKDYEENNGRIDAEDMIIQKLKVSYTVVEESKM